MVAQKSELDWDWRNQEVIGHDDPSVGNTSKLTESERSALVDAIVLRLQKPMGDAGYDDERIREIATTTRIRFIDAGTGPPLIFTTSIGLEGGCDALGNCPFWVFRHTDDGFLSLLNTIAASYTPKQTESGLEVVFLHHLSAKESGLAVYRFADDKLQGTGCYTAVWPKPSNDPTQVSAPKIELCKQPPLLESAHPVTPEPSAATEPAPQPPAAQSKPDATEQTPPAATEAPKADQPQSAPDQPAPASDQAQPQPASPSEQQASGAKQEAPKVDQTQPQPSGDQSAPGVKQEAPKPDQPPPSNQTAPEPNSPAPDNQQAEPAPKPDQPTQGRPPANPEPAPPQASPQEPGANQPAPNSKQTPQSSPDEPQPNS